MFVARERELAKLQEQIASERKTAVLVYGKRRVGKSTLIAEAAKSFDGVDINHFCPQTTSFPGSVELLAQTICDCLELPGIRFDRLKDIFEFLGTQNRQILLVLDEYQNMKASGGRGEVDSYLQEIIDALPQNVKLILCGSYIRVMKELLERDNPLFGRFTSIVRLDELDYHDAAKFYESASVRKKIEFYSIFGGSPYVLQELDPNASLKKNIVRKLLPQTGSLRTYIESIALAEIQKAYDIRIFEIIGNGKKKYSDIQTKLGGRDTGNLDKQLKVLLHMELLQKVSPINRRNDSRKQFYIINDNLLRFYFTYVFNRTGLISKLGEEAYYETYIKPTVDQFVSHRFEDIFFQYIARESRAGNLPGLRDYGPFWYDDPKTKQNGEFDCVLETANGFVSYDCKFYQKPMTEQECKEEERQVRAIPALGVRGTGFVCSAGFNFTSDTYHLISGEDLYR